MIGALFAFAFGMFLLGAATAASAALTPPNASVWFIGVLAIAFGGLAIWQEWTTK